MNLLFVASGFPPATFSENLCNGKLVLALLDAGYHVDVISKVHEIVSYSTTWSQPWLPLRPFTLELTYPLGNKFERAADTLISSAKMHVWPIEGIRWGRRAYEKAIELHRAKHYDAILTRSPSDISHLVGYRLSKTTGVPWIANWNDPAAPIWPEPYKAQYPCHKQKSLIKQTGMFLKQASVNTFPSSHLFDHFCDNFPFLAEKLTRIIPHIGLLPGLLPQCKRQPNDEWFTMCHSGNMSPERNPDCLFRAMRELIDEGHDRMRLDIIGRANPFTEKLSQKYNLTGFVRFKNGLPYMDAMNEMRKYDVLVLLEAVMEKGIFFPSKLTDYAQLSRPILAVSPKAGFAHDMLEQFGGGIAVDNTCVESIKEGIRKFYQAWKEDKLADEYGTQTLYANFSPSKVISIYDDMLNNLPHLKKQR